MISLSKSQISKLFPADNVKNTIIDAGSIALHVVSTVDMAYILDMVYILDTVYTVYTIQTALHCLNSSMYSYIYS